MLEDHRKTIAVYLRNNGLGPLIIDGLTFVKDGQSYPKIDDCLTLDRRSYMHTSTDDSVRRVVLPNSSLTIFEDQLKGNESKEKLNRMRHQLSSITLKVVGRDIYDNKTTIERDFQWFARYTPKSDL